LTVLAGGFAASAAAQSSSDKWNVFVAPYLMGAAMDGATTVRGASVDLDVSASDIFSNIEFGGMGVVVARQGHWGFGSDVIWMALGAPVRNTDVDFNQGAFAFYGLRELSPVADLTFGARINTLQGALTFKSTGTEVSQNKTWVDPIAGVTLRTAAGKPVQLRVYTEVGGFGVGSDFTWQMFPTVSIKVGQSASLELGYRWLDLDYGSGDGNNEFRYDVLTQGPVIGFGFRF
jgi:hypothetical protein